MPLHVESGWTTGELELASHQMRAVQLLSTEHKHTSSSSVRFSCQFSSDTFAPHSLCCHPHPKRSAMIPEWRTDWQLTELSLHVYLSSPKGSEDYGPSLVMLLIGCMFCALQGRWCNPSVFCLNEWENAHLTNASKHGNKYKSKFPNGLEVGKCAVPKVSGPGQSGVLRDSPYWKPKS